MAEKFQRIQLEQVSFYKSMYTAGYLNSLLKWVAMAK